MINNIDDEINQLKERIDILEQSNESSIKIIKTLSSELEKINKEEERYKKRKRTALMIMGVVGIVTVIVYYYLISSLMRNFM